MKYNTCGMHYDWEFWDDYLTREERERAEIRLSDMTALGYSYFYERANGERPPPRPAGLHATPERRKKTP